MDVDISSPLAPVHHPRPSSQPSLDQNTHHSDLVPGLPRSRSALPEGTRHPVQRIFKPKPESLIEEPVFSGSSSLLNIAQRLEDGILPDMRPLSVNAISRTHSPSSPKPPRSDSVDVMRRSPEIGRPLNVTDALSYLDAVKGQFQDKPDVYNHFLDIMKDFKSQIIDTPGVIERVSMLFHGNPLLIQGFNTFLPQGYRIEVSADPLDPNIIKVTTPMGTTTQSTNNLGQFTRDLREGPVFSSSGLQPYGAGMPTIPGFQIFDVTYSPSFHGQSTTAAASFLGNLGNKYPVEQQPANQFNHAIQYLNKIKARYADNSNTYKQFLEILQTYQKEQKHLQDSQVYVQVQMLFKDAPDLLSEFKNFLPDASASGNVQSGVVGIPPQPLGGPSGSGSAWAQPDISSDRGDKPAKKISSSAKRRRRQPEVDMAPAPPARAAPSRSKKARHHNKPGDRTPPFSPSQGPVSPETHLHLHNHAPIPSLHSSHNTRPQHHHSSFHGQAHSSDQLLFFERAKKSLENREAYDEFLKLLTLYSTDIIDTRTMISMAEIFLGSGDLMAELKHLMRWDGRLDHPEYGPPGSIRTGPPEAMSALPADDGEGPSYRRLPDSERNLACSGRDQLCRSVLNNEWVSHPTWATEEAGFVAHKKNSFEEVLHKCEEERHEYHVQLEALFRTIAILEPINSRLDDMTNEERLSFRLKADFGGTCKSVYHRVIKKVYGREVGLEILQALQECPSVAVPVVLARLKQKDEEWRRAQREWSRTWREVDTKNFYKSLDYQGISFKANDKKNITAKHFMADIEAIKVRDAESRKYSESAHNYGSPSYQLQYLFEDTSVLHDSLKLVYSFLDHSQVQYSPQERRSVERFLRSFIPLLFMYPVVEFNAACGPLDGGQDDEWAQEGQRSGRRSTGSTHSHGIPASDLRKKLLKTAQEKSSGKETAAVSAVHSARSSPAPSVKSQNMLNAEEGDKNPSKSEDDDVWIKESVATATTHYLDGDKSPPFFVNTTFYTMLRLLQLLYSRLLTCKTIGAKLGAEKHVSFLENPIATELGLEDPNGPSAVLAQAIEALGDQNASEGSNVVYLYLLDACEKVFDNELDQTTFEEQMRWFFGSKAYHIFTLDKLITAMIKQVQTILSDNKCQEILSMMQHMQGVEMVSNRDIMRYRREAERMIGTEDPLYRIDWNSKQKRMRIQLVWESDPSVDGDGGGFGRWREYVDSYVMNYPTEWVPQESDKNASPVFLRRCMETTGVMTRSEMTIRVSLGTYRLFYEAGCEDCIWRRWGKEDGDMLMERAKAREEERRKSRWLQP